MPQTFSPQTRVMPEIVAQIDTQLGTGLPGLDRIFKGLIPGDNLVWRIDPLEDFKFFLKPYCDSARDHGRKLVYFRFAEHEPLVAGGRGAVRVIDASGCGRGSALSLNANTTKQKVLCYLEK